MLTDEISYNSLFIIGRMEYSTGLSEIFSFFAVTNFTLEFSYCWCGGDKNKKMIQSINPFMEAHLNIEINSANIKM